MLHFTQSHFDVVSNTLENYVIKNYNPDITVAGKNVTNRRIPLLNFATEFVAGECYSTKILKDPCLYFFHSIINTESSYTEAIFVYTENFSRCWGTEDWRHQLDGMTSTILKPFYLLDENFSWDWSNPMEVWVINWISV